MLNIKEIRENNGLTQKEFAELIGVKPLTVIRYEQNPDKIPEMAIKLIEYQFGFRQPPTTNPKNKSVTALASPALSPGTGIPLMSIAALGGSVNFDTAIDRAHAVAEYYAPEFKDADFMLPVKGDSMNPTYHKGDVIACKILNNPSFIEWNRPHVVAVQDRGVLIKRIMPGANDNEYLFVSDNDSYPAFEVPVEEIQSIAVILGLVRVEG